jgi:serine/threonine protein kinase
VAAEIAAEDAEEKGAENADSNATADAAFLAALHGECNKIHLARGGNGDVFRVVYPASGKELALKVIKNVDDSAMALYEREFNNAKRLSHSNIVRIFDLERKGDSLFIRMELFGRDLASALSTGPLSERLACRFTRQLLRALKHCHSRKVVHRDLKGRNVLVDMVAKKVKLCDFGSSSIASAPQNDPSRFIQFTPNWAAPEILLSTGWTDRADIWSLGCVVIEMLTAKRPWAELGQVADMVLIYHIANKAVTPQLPTAIGAACQDFLHRCLQRDPQRRPSAAELLEHPWICGGRLASQRVQQPPTR